MMRTMPLLTTRREFSFRARFLVALLALVQFIAPTWHVCEMGGASCCPPKTGDSLQHCASPGASAADDAAKPKCEKCPEAESAEPLTVSATSAPHGENCLAKLMLGMPLQNAAPVALLEFSSRRIESTPATLQQLSIGDLPQPPSRGPPVSSL